MCKSHHVTTDKGVDGRTHHNPDDFASPIVKVAFVEKLLAPRLLDALTNSGVYNVTGAWVYDLAGNRATYSAVQLQTLGINTSFTVTDGTFVANVLTTTVATEPGKLVLSFSAAQWLATSNTLAFNLAYDSSIVHFDTWRTGSSGSFAVNSITSEVGSVGTTNVSASISNSGDNTDFIQLVFSTTARQGNFAYSYSSASVNSASVANSTGSYQFFIQNSVPTGGVTITGTVTQNQTLTAANTLTDADGLGTISYQWKAAGVNIAGATANSYTLTQAEVGKVITVIASYTDLLGSAESKLSTPTPAVAVNQTSTGSTGNDSLTGSAGNDSLDGGAGTDAVVYSGSRSNFSLTKTSTGFTLADGTGAAGTDTLQNVERLKFSDGAIALDVGATQPAGQTAMLLGAVLPGRLAFDSSKQALLGAAIDLFDQGYSLQTLSGAVMRLPIWDVLTGKATPSNTDIATYLLTNVNGVAPDGTTLANAVASLNTETDFASQGNFLWHLAESTANQTHIGLVGLASTGLAFTI